MTAYQQLEARFRRLGAIEEAIGVLNWDSATMMPAGGAATRAEQLATLSLLAHQQLTAAEIGDLLAEAESASDALDPWQRGNLREMRRRRSNADGGARRAGRSSLARVVRMRDGVAQGPPGERFCRRSAVTRRDAAACSARLRRPRRRGSG